MSQRKIKEEKMVKRERKRWREVERRMRRQMVVTLKYCFPNNPHSLIHNCKSEDREGKTGDGKRKGQGGVAPIFNVWVFRALYERPQLGQRSLV